MAIIYNVAITSAENSFRKNIIVIRRISRSWNTERVHANTEDLLSCLSQRKKGSLTISLSESRKPLKLEHIKILS